MTHEAGPGEGTEAGEIFFHVFHSFVNSHTLGKLGIQKLGRKASPPFCMQKIFLPAPSALALWLFIVSICHSSTKSSHLSLSGCHRVTDSPPPPPPPPHQPHQKIGPVLLPIPEQNQPMGNIQSASTDPGARSLGTEPWFGRCGWRREVVGAPSACAERAGGTIL